MLRKYMLILALFIVFGLFESVLGQASCGTTNRPQGSTNDEYDRRPDKTKLTIASYNVEWLFSDSLGCSSHELACPGECQWTTEESALAHLDSIAEEVTRIDADIIALPEVQDCCVLTALAAKVSGYSHYLVSGTDAFTGQDVGILTRIDPVTDFIRTDGTVDYPIPESVCPSPTPTPDTNGLSKNIFARFTMDNVGSFVLFGLHFLSRPDDVERCYEREAQASVARNAINEHLTNFPNDNVVALGDFNDFDGHVPDIQSSTPISSTLDIVKSVGSGLRNVAEFIPQQERYTNWWDRNEDCAVESPLEYSAIDHILLSQGLVDHVTDAQILHYDNSCNRTLSDHFAVKVTLDFDSQIYGHDDL